jgi:hypothetical protein
MSPGTKKIQLLEKTLKKLERAGLRVDTAPLRRRMRTPPAGNVRVSNVGLLNAGKSTLFNALCGQPEYFATSDARCTTSEQTIELDGYVLVDTPGLDANEMDDNTAAQITKNADMLLFVHNIKTGEFDRQEADFLERLRSIFPDPEMLARTVVPVFTHCEGHTEEQLDEILEASHLQWETLTGVKPSQTFTVRSQTYFRGIEKGKAKLCEVSEIPRLSSFIREQRFGLEEQRHRLWWHRIQTDTAQLAREVREIIAMRQCVLDKEDSAYEKSAALAHQDFAQFEQNIRQLHKNYKAREKAI